MRRQAITQHWNNHEEPERVDLTPHYIEEYKPWPFWKALLVVILFLSVFLLLGGIGEYLNVVVSGGGF